MGGGGSQPSKTTTTTTNAPPEWAVPYYKDVLNQANTVAAAPYQSYGGQQVAPLTQNQQEAEALSRSGAWGLSGDQQTQRAALQFILNGAYDVNPYANPYLGATTGTNQYAGSNKYLQGMIDSSNKDITKQYTQSTAPGLATQFAQGGAFGGSAYNTQVQNANQALAESLANSENQYRFQDYTTQQGLAENALNRQQADIARNAGIYQGDVQNKLQAAQQNAATLLGASQGVTGAQALQSQFLGQYANLSGQQQAVDQQNLNNAYNDWYARNYGYPQQQLNTKAQALNVISGSFQSGSTTAPNPNYQAKSLGGGLASAGAGALSGAAAGSVVPGIGTVAGGIVGGAAGLLGYYM